ncbi:MAG: glycosyltransferase [Bacteroidetes bacterium]|nr:glycosyltransferase [Bacteroidota bacterium]
MKTLLLYTRMADYFYRGLLHLSQEYNAEILAFTHPVDPNAPFQFSDTKKIKLLSEDGKNEAELTALATAFNPNLIYVAGWADKRYNSIVQNFRKKNIPVILGMDNPWKGNLRQQAGSLLRSGKIQSLADYIWVPGSPQYAFASRLGFNQKNILTGLYSANTATFEKARQKAGDARPKKLLFVGRFVEYKKPLMLANAFRAVQQEMQSDWSLHFIGRGPQEGALRKLEAPDLQIHDFVQPDQLPDTLVKHGVFCLPSDQEHWGVVVHEAAAAGMPLLLSDTVGAASDYLIPGYNGYRFKTGNQADLEIKLKNIMQLDNKQLHEMGNRSSSLARKWNYDRWAATFISPLK